MTTTLDDEVTDLRRPNAELQRRVDEALAERDEGEAQKAAMAEILEVINSSPGDLAPVFDEMLEKATRLCDAAYGQFWTYDGVRFHPVTMRGDPAFAEWVLARGPLTPGQRAPHGRIVQGERFVHIADALKDEAYHSQRFRKSCEISGTRTQLVVPLRKDEMLLGVIHVYRQEVRAFTDKQIALLQNFAAQAVIAMENARLITETREALEQQTATTAILQVINSSPGDLSPVFDAVLEKALHVCDAVYGHAYTYDGERVHPVAIRGEASFVNWLRQLGSYRPAQRSPMERTIRGEHIVHVVDALQEEAYHTAPGFKKLIDASGIRTGVTVPLRKENTLLGAINIYRKEVRPFSDQQINLLQNFAAQAVIAIENARLINETREALEQQTATAEVLQVINSSPGDLAPVFDVILDKAHSLCDAAQGALVTNEGGYFGAVATHGLPESFARLLRQPRRGGGPREALLRGEEFVHIPDLADPLSPHHNPISDAAVELAGLRTALFVPLRRDNTLLGYITAYHQEVRSFSNKEIALLQNFAGQAVIAIENARLLNEIRQRQAELRVTFDNMGDGVVMFDESLHLAAWNRNFQQILDLPDDLLVERPSYADYIRILADRGEFGTEDIEAEISRRLEHTDQELLLERIRPDGRVIEVRRNAVQGGGFVLIYSDITERKRSEAEIRAARDAAEAAYRDLKTAQAGLIQAEKMASLGQLTAGIAHEIKNPLNFINNFAGLSVELLHELKETAAPAITALDDDKRAEIDETMEMLIGNLDKIAEHGRRADNIVKSMLEHSRGSSGERRSVDFNGLIEEALNLAYHGTRAQDQSFNVTLERDYTAPIAPIELVPQDITRVCLNLFSNGFYAAAKRQQEGSDPNFKPTMMVSTRDLGDEVEVRVRDNGIGIPPEIKDKLFQPFFTTKPTGEGTGLGLSISYDIVTQQHGGTIAVDSRVGEFTEFMVRLPRTYRAAMAATAS